MTTEEFVHLARQAGFGCDCTGNCAYHIRFKGDWVLLPNGQTEALERLERWIEIDEARMALQREKEGLNSFHYWQFWPPAIRRR